MEVRWKLRMAAAQREIWTGAQLRRLLAERAGVEMSAASVSALMRQAPKQLKLSTLQALCVALDCQPGELIEVDTTPVAKPAGRSKPARRAGSRAASDARAPRRRSDRWRASAPTAATTGSFTRAIAASRAIGAPSTTPPRKSAPAAASDGELRPTASGPRCYRCIRRAGPRKQPTPRRCRRCGEVRRHAAHGLCNACYQRDPMRVGVWVQGAAGSAWRALPGRGSARSPAGCWSAQPRRSACATCAAWNARSAPASSGPPR